MFKVFSFLMLAGIFGGLVVAINKYPRSRFEEFLKYVGILIMFCAVWFLLIIICWNITIMFLQANGIS